jgi:hypothetical protein
VIDLLGAAEEVGCVGHKGVGRLQICNALFFRADDIRSAPSPCRVLQFIPRSTLGGVCANNQRVLCHRRAHEPERRLHRLRASLARELPIGRLYIWTGANRLGENGRRGLDRIRVRLAADPHGPDLLSRNAGALQRIPSRLDGDGGGILIGACHRLLDNRCISVRSLPDPRDFAGWQPVAWDICTVADDAYVFDRSHSSVFPVKSDESE